MYSEQTVFLSVTNHLLYLRRRRRLCFYFGLFVCPSDNWKSCERTLTKFLGVVGHGPGTKGIYWWRSASLSGSGSLFRITIRIREDLNCRNHSAILLCWRSAELCALWVLLVLLILIVFIVYSLHFEGLTAWGRYHDDIANYSHMQNGVSGSLSLSLGSWLLNDPVPTLVLPVVWLILISLYVPDIKFSYLFGNSLS